MNKEQQTETSISWQSMDSAPKDGTLIFGLYDDGEVLIRWAKHRACMLAGIGGGNGYFGAGWEDDENHLIVDAPSKWRSECQPHNKLKMHGNEIP